jgi:hypothetical protein
VVESRHAPTQVLHRCSPAFRFDSGRDVAQAALALIYDNKIVYGQNVLGAPYRILG